jgi:ABC-type multidrug transport system fused ATPase/permease subunit
MTPTFTKKPTFINFALYYITYYKVKFFLMILIVTFAVFFEIGQSYIMKIIIDTITNPGVMDEIIKTSLIFICLFFLFNQIMNIFFRLSAFIGMSFLPSMRKKIRSDLFEYTHKHSANFFSDNFTGALANKINSAGSAFDDGISDFIWILYNSIISIIITWILLYITHAYIFLLSFVMTLFFFVVAYFSLVKVKKYEFSICKCSFYYYG